MRVLVTGSNGRIGRAAVEQLLGHGHRVFGVDAEGRPDALCATRVDDLTTSYAIHRALDDAQRALDGSIDAVVHLANLSNVHVAPPERVLRENLSINASVFHSALEHGATRLVFISSVQAMVAGIDGVGASEAQPPHELPMSEAMEPRPGNAYGISKLLTERMLEELVRVGQYGSGASSVSLRFPWVLHDKAWTFNIERTQRHDFRWGGPEAYAYIAMSDAGRAIALACEAEVEGHEAFWIAAPDPRPNETVEALVDRFYKDVPGAQGCVERDSFNDTSKAERVLEWRAERLLRDARREAGVPGPLGVGDEG